MKKILLILVAVILFCFLGSVGVLLAFEGKKIPLLNEVITIPFLEKDQNKVIRKMMDETDKVKTYENNGEYIVKMTQQGGVKSEAASNNPLQLYPSLMKDLTLKMNYNLKNDNTDIQNVKKITTANISYDAGGISLTASGNFIFINKKLYFNFKLPSFLFFNFLNQYNDKWFEIDQGKLQSQNDKLHQEDLGGISSYLLTGNNFQNKISDGTMQEAKKLLETNQVMKIVERLPDEKVEGANCYHYKISVNKDNLQLFLTSLIKKLEIEQNKNLPIVNMNEENVKKFLNILTKAEGEVWIGKNDYRQRQNTFVLTLDYSKITDNLLGNLYSLNYLVDISGKNTFINYDQSIKIEEPASSTDLVDLATSQLVGARMKARDARRMSDLKQIQTALELYYSEADRYPDEILPDEKLEYKGNVFMYKVPKYALPADGNCPANFEYKYRVKDNGKSYELEYCMGEGNSVFKTGINTISPDTILSSAASLNNSISYITVTADDKDGDGLSNSDETKYKTNPNMKDTDDDGLWDYEEIFVYKTDPLKADTDGDGFKDGSEIKGWYNPKGKGRIEHIFSDSVYALRKTELDLYYSDIKAYVSRAYDSTDFRKFLNEEFGITREDFNQKVINLINSKISDNIDFTDFKQIDKDHVRFDYVVTFKINKYGFKDSPIKDKAYLVKIKNDWYLDLLPEFKEIKDSDKYTWVMMMNSFSKSSAMAPPPMRN